MPPFVNNQQVIKEEDEITEADYILSDLGCDEQMWNYEGKTAAEDVVLNFLLKTPEFYHERVLGEDLFLTSRIPNPSSGV